MATEQQRDRKRRARKHVERRIEVWGGEDPLPQGFELLPSETRESKLVKAEAELTNLINKGVMS